MSVNEKIKTEMHGQIISIEFRFSFPTIYNNIVCTDGKVPAIIMLLYGGISSYIVSYIVQAYSTVTNMLGVHSFLEK